jgi:hypothetical protein
MNTKEKTKLIMKDKKMVINLFEFYY